MDDAEKTLSIVIERIDSLSHYYNGLDLPDISMRTQSRPSAVCRATGDPHYRSFDGFPFHIRPPGRVVMYKSTARTFEVQTDLYAFSGRPSLNCAVAAREGNDIVVITMCANAHTPSYRRTCGTKRCKENSYPKVGITGGTFPRYVVDFASGARVIAQVAYWSRIRRRYLNVYLTAPGVDYGQTVGVCGNNNGNPHDDLDLSWNRWVNDLSTLRPEQLPDPNFDLFSWYPSEIIDEEPLPPHAEECDYIDPPFVRPILNNPDAEDITRLLLDRIPPAREQAQGITFDGTVVDEIMPPEIGEDEAKAKCEQLREHTATKRCLELFPEFDLDTFLNQCVEDVILTGGNEDFLAIAIDALEDQCADQGNRDLNTWEKDEDGNPTEPDKELQTKLCPNSCSGNGDCVRSRCVCFEHFSGDDCSIDSRLPPTLEEIDPPFCDSRGRLGCPKHVTIGGSNFQRTDAIACRFNGDHETKATFLSSLEVRCEIPVVSHSGSNEMTQTVEVTTDGQHWSTGVVSFTWYDSICQVCDADVCKQNENSCTIDDKCYLSHQHSKDNICHMCDPEESTVSWVIDYSNGAECGPRFSKTFYNARIVGSGRKGDHLVTVDARNPLVVEDPSSTITYSIRQINDKKRAHIFSIDENGHVTLSEDISVTSDLFITMEFENLVHVEAKDQVGNVAEAAIYVELEMENSPPFFEHEKYTFEIAEDVHIGEEVGAVVATDPDGGEWGTLTYSWAEVEKGTANTFLVDPKTGMITVGRPLDFATREVYRMRMNARDGGGQSHITNVKITVLHVNKAPKDILLSSTSVDERSEINTVVGNVSVIDPDVGDTHELELLGGSSDFDIDGTSLVTKRVFDYDNADDRIHSVSIKATDEGGLSVDVTFEISVQRIRRPPKNVRFDNPDLKNKKSIQIPETTDVDRIIADITVDKDSDVVGCTLTETGDGHFELQNMRLIVVKELDSTEHKQFDLQVVCADENGLQSEPFDFAVEVEYVYIGPQNIVLSLEVDPVPEDVKVGTVLGLISAEDRDADSDPLTFSLGDSVSDMLSLQNAECDNSNGFMHCITELVTSGNLDFETSSNGEFIFSVRVVGMHGIAYTVDLTIPLLDVNEPATGVTWLSGGSVYETAQPGDVVGEIAVIDEDIGQQYTVVLKSHEDVFEIESKASQRRSLDGSVNLNFGARLLVRDASTLVVGQSLHVDLSVTDQSSNPTTNEFVIEVSVEREPLSISFDGGNHIAFVEENSAVGTVVSTFDVRGAPADEEPIVALNPRNGRLPPFRVDGLEVIVDGNLDYEQQQMYIVDVSVTFPSSSESIENVLFHVYIVNQDEPIVFTNLPSAPIRVNTDRPAESQVFTFKASDPEFHTVQFTLVSDSSNAFELAENGVLKLAVMPSSHGISTGLYEIEVEASIINQKDDNPSVSATVMIILVDDCDGQTCSNNGVCEDDFQFYTCRCNDGFSGDDCEFSDSELNDVDSETNPDLTVDQTVKKEKSNSNSDSMAASAFAGIAIGAAALIVLIVLILVLVIRRRRQASLEENYLEHVKTLDNPTFVSPNYTSFKNGEDNYTYSMAFQTGVTNPLYAWYQPDYTRQETTNELLSAPEGSFIIRDSKATPGWHMLGVRTDQAVIHEKIKRTEDGLYELVPSNSKPQPAFPDLPSLVGFYGNCQGDVPFTLNVSSMANPMYSANFSSSDNYEAVDRGMWMRDEQAPIVPLKEREKGAVKQFISVDEDDIYLNTTEAKAALSADA